MKEARSTNRDRLPTNRIEKVVSLPATNRIEKAVSLPDFPVAEHAAMYVALPIKPTSHLRTAMMLACFDDCEWSYGDAPAVLPHGWSQMFTILKTRDDHRTRLVWFDTHFVDSFVWRHAPAGLRDRFEYAMHCKPFVFMWMHYDAQDPSYLERWISEANRLAKRRRVYTEPATIDLSDCSR